MRVITTKAELAHLSTEQRRRRPPIDLRLIETFDADLSADEEEMLSNVYREVHGAPRGEMTYGGSMLTYPDRYRPLDDKLISLVSNRLASRKSLRIHDMAASNAITSLELFSRLKHLPGLEFIASDYFDALTVATPLHQKWSVVLDRDGNCLQAVSKDMILAPAGRLRWSEVAWQLRSYFIRRRLLRLIALSGATVDKRTIALWHPKCLALAATDKRFVLRHEDIFHPKSEVYDVLRVMGTISRFSEQALPRLFAGLLPLVADGGLFVAGDSGTFLDDTRRATVFERRGLTFVAVDEWNGGFSLCAHVESARLPSP